VIACKQSQHAQLRYVLLSLSWSAAWQLLSVQRSLTAYYDRFKAVLNPINAQNIQRLLNIASALHKCMQQQQTPVEGQQQPVESSSGSRLTTVNDLLFDLGLDSINMFELAHWVKNNKMAFKVGLHAMCADLPVQLQAVRHAVDMCILQSSAATCSVLVGRHMCYVWVDRELLLLS
jgi:aryl carrier-like protein